MFGCFKLGNLLRQFSYSIFAIVIVIIMAETTSHAAPIRMAVQNSEPKYLFKDGRVIGLCGEIYQLLAEELSKKNIDSIIPSSSQNIKTILADLREGRQDIYCGAGRNDAREKTYIYSTRPIYQVSNVLAVPEKNRKSLRNFSDIRKSLVEIHAFNGASSTDYLKLHVGVNVDDRWKNLDDALLNLTTGHENKAFFYHDLGLVYLVQRSKLPLKVLPHRFRTYNHWIIYSRKMSIERIAEIENILLQLDASRQLDKIRQKYLTNP